jgi:hypothetical protein
MLLPDPGSIGAICAQDDSHDVGFGQAVVEDGVNQIGASRNSPIQPASPEREVQRRANESFFVLLGVGKEYERPVSHPTRVTI